MTCDILLLSHNCVICPMLMLILVSMPLIIDDVAVADNVCSVFLSCLIIGRAKSTLTGQYLCSAIMMLYFGC